MSSARLVHQALVDAATASTGADQGWLLGATADGLTVLAAAGGDDPAALIGSSVSAEGARGLAVSSGQPAALRPPESDSSNEGAGGAEGVPGSVLAAPCAHDDVVGVIEVVRARGSEGFTFDDVEIVSLLADVAGAAIAEAGSAVEVTPPARLSVELTSLAAQDSQRYADVARVIEALLGQG